MSKIRLTKAEFKRQKDALKMFQRFLPTLQLKKQQLQTEIIKLRRAIDEQQRKIEQFDQSINNWIGLFAEEVNLDKLISLKEINTSEGNIAGVDIPIFESVQFDEKEYNFMNTPLWIDSGLEAVKRRTSLLEEAKVIEKQLELIREELRITTQRVNLFEKVKIPQAQENIRKIRIFLGDLQTAAVITGKIAKNKLKLKEEAVGVSV